MRLLNFSDNEKCYGQLFIVMLLKICSFQVTDLLGKYPDLMEGFNDFVERSENIGNCWILPFFKSFSLSSLSIRLFLISILIADGFLAGVINKSM